MSNWNTWTIGDKIRYTYDDFDGRGHYDGVLTVKEESHGIVRVDDMNLWLDDSTADMFRKIG